MLTEFESRLADVLGSRIAAPFAGRVRRRGAPAPGGSGPVVRVGVDAFEPLQPDVGSVRPEQVPGSDDLRRVLRLGVTVGVDVEPQNSGDRLQQLLGIDAATYELDDPGIRSAALLVQPGDQGFLIDWLHLDEADLRGDPDGASPVTLRAEGWFWPVGQTGETGRAIERALVREFRLPVHLAIAEPLLAGGAPVALGITFGATGTMAVAAGGTTTLPFGSIALRLLDAGGGPGAGSLSDGQPGPDGTRLAAVDD
ncbi:MAG: hypothetical protein ACRD0G_09820, partial [Acidimicrobiales bacterium]